MNVLSLFDGMSCGQIALERAGIKVDNYFASEIDKYAIQVAMKNYPKTVQIGNVNGVDLKEYRGIDTMLGGSPCQDLSQIKNDGKGLEGEKSKVFFRYVDALNEAQPKYFLYENVASMKEKDRNIITGCLGVEPVEISSKCFSAQDRPRLYWTNIPFEKTLPPEHPDMLMDIMNAEVDEKYYYDDDFEHFFGEDKRMVGTLYRRYPNGKVKFTEMTSRVYNTKFKCPTLTAVGGGHQEKKVYTWDKRVRKLTPLEYERLQTVPEGYTSSASDSQRYKMLGNGWSVDTIVHILGGLKHGSRTDGRMESL